MKKRGLSLFLALALCLTLLPAAAFANGEPETSTLHTHYLCGNGQACSHVGGHSEDSKTTFATAIRQDDNGYVWVGDGTQEQPYQCVLSEGTYYLATDLALEAPSNTQFGSIQITENVTLCLNGHTITVKANREAFKITKSVDTPSPTLTLTDCQGGGKITHDSSFLGNGVNLSENCNFIMYGGSITGNNAASFGSGGVCVYGSMTVSGSVRITDNVNGGSKGDDGIYTGGTASNVRLVGRTTITIDGPLTEGTQIGVLLYSNRIFTSGWSKNMSDKTFSSYFTADDSSSTVALENGELKLSNPHTHSWTYALSTTTTGSATITATCKNCAENNNTDFHGGSVTIAAPEADALTYDGSPKAAAVTTSGDWLGASADNIRITYKQGETTLPTAPTDAGTYTAGITVGEGGGAVTASVEYTIAPKELTEPTIEIASGSVYDGNAKTPNVTVKDKSAYTYDAAPDLSKPEPDKDYTVSGLIGEDKLTTAPTLAYDPAAPDLTKTGEAAKITASGASAGENYEITYVDGKLTVTSRPSSGGGGSSSSGGGGGSSSSDKPSASTGKTETTNKDGSTTKTETKPDGSSKTEVKDASGSIGTVKTDKNGQATAETTLSSKAVEDAKKNGEAVKAPVEVEASRDSNTAPTVKVELPKNAGETAVEIPVSNVKPGTVAVLVHPDGTEEIVKNSLPTEDSIRLTMDGSATVKIMDNSKDFIDTRAHWAKDAIDFVSARGLVNGISNTIYAPNNSTTRAQLWTILARQNDAGLTGGSIWYEKAQNWAKDKGVSDGANPNAAINRAQMVTMLWRAMGQPAAASDASFADVPADSYYAQAVAWAIENGITAGVGNGKFDPDAACTRGQIATFLYRYMK